jgi:spermidine/putrescine transport system substrate-binding protein
MTFSKLAKLCLFATCWLLAFILTSCHSSSKPTLYIFTWSDLFKPELIAQFEKQFNCHLVIDTYDSNESMYAKLKLSSVNYDIIFPSNYYIEILHKQQMIQAIDPAKAPNIYHLDPKYFKLVDPLPAVPFIVSFSGLAYRKDKVTVADPSWDIFARSDLKGRMTMLNDSREAIGAALRYLGYSINSRSASEVAKAGDLLLGWRKNLAKFESEQYKNGLASGEFIVVQGYSIDIMQVITENPEVAFVYPKEGAIMSIDSMAIPASAQNVELAHQFINFMLETQVALDNVLYTNSLVPLLPLYDQLDAAKRKDPILFPSDQELQKMELLEDLQGDVQLYYKVWDKVKAG